MNTNSNLSRWGWDLFFATQLELEKEKNNWIPARVIGQEKGLYRLATDVKQECWAQLAGKFRHEQEHLRGMFPAVGDWVLCQAGDEQDRALIHKVLDRRSCFYRKDPGADRPQVVAANIDVIFIVTSLNQDLNRKRLDRYISIAYDSGASPILILSKKDLVANAEEILSELEEAYIGVPMEAVSVFEEETCKRLLTYLPPGKTGVLLGSSGVGKSTLTNFFLGEHLIATQGVREDDDRGRHTTTSRSLYRLQNGALLMDTPGMRELALFDQEEGVGELFEDIVHWTESCRFSDCRHETEPGCAIQEALQSGALEEERWLSYLKLQKEIKHQERRSDHRLYAEDKKRWKKITMDMRVRVKRKERGEI
ncbi:ribosome small subunit-dependent GTPase A [Bdellovibrio sp. HCB2-146]|uniref:ribosome small subunit-dependent GTPase A n=1 Tax=Bdellovibrio sp. HCB2-146 TaxID=3394362 RepID=UPI0039BC934A